MTYILLFKIYSELFEKINIESRSTRNKISQTTKQRTAIPNRNRVNTNTHIRRSEQNYPRPSALNSLSRFQTRGRGLETIKTMARSQWQRGKGQQPIHEKIHFFTAGFLDERKIGKLSDPAVASFRPFPDNLGEVSTRSHSRFFTDAERKLVTVPHCCASLPDVVILVYREDWSPFSIFLRC